MRNIMLTVCGLLVLILTGCRQEEKPGIDRVLDVNISLEAKAISLDEPCYLSVSLKNESLNPVTLPDGMVILEFTSYSGRVQHMLPVYGDGNNPDPEWEVWKNYTLEAGEVINFKLDIRKLLYGNKVLIPGGLPADDYTLNAFLTPVKDIGTIRSALKIRSNYIDVAVNTSTES
jgi:hypothetical protein